MFDNFELNQPLNQPLSPRFYQVFFTEDSSTIDFIAAVLSGLWLGLLIMASMVCVPDLLGLLALALIVPPFCVWVDCLLTFFVESAIQSFIRLVNDSRNSFIGFDNAIGDSCR